MNLFKKEKELLTKYANLVIRLLGLVVMLSLGTAVFLITKPSNIITPKEAKDFAKTSVTITNLVGTSGGTGSIMRSGLGGSIILTNKHVCALVKNGAKVNTNDGDSDLVLSYKEYKRHDLCLVKVLRNFGVNTKLASEKPEKYTPATISGHPSLLPHVVSKGNFSGEVIVSIITEKQSCTPADFLPNSPDLAYCAMFGFKPVIMMFNSQLVTGLIMPGSSGSAVYNEKGELTAVVFAGQEGLSFALAVPYAYVRDFLNAELGRDDGYKFANYSSKTSSAKDEVQINRIIRNERDVMEVLKQHYDRIKKNK